MKPTVTSIGFAILCGLGLLFGSCSLDTPEAPIHDNPFDPDNPDTHGDPFKVQAELTGGAIRVTWREVDHPPVAGYSVYRNENDSAFARIAELSDATFAYADAAIRNGNRYGYYVVARFGNHESDSSNLAKAYVNASPALLIRGDSAETPTRNVTLTILAFGASEMLLSNTADFAGAVWEPYSTTKPWQLTTGAGTKRVFMRVVYAAGDTTGVVSDEIEPANLNPSVVIAGGAAETPTRRVPLRMYATGAIEMQVSNAILTGSEAWVAYNDSLQWELTSGAGTKTVYVKVRNDFLIDRETSDKIEPAELNPSLVIAGGATQTPTRRVPLSIDATGSIVMQVSNSVLTGNEEWIAYADSIPWDLATGAGTKTVNVKVMNDFLIEAEASDQIEPSPLSPSLRILPDSTFINHTDVTLSMPNTGASEMKVANNSDSTSVGWLPYQLQIPWNLDATDGWKKVNAWFRNDWYSPSERAIDSVGLDTRAAISSFTWTGSQGDTLRVGDSLTFELVAADDAFGTEISGSVFAQIEGWEPVRLLDQNDGSYYATFSISRWTPEIIMQPVKSVFIDRNGNLSDPLQAERVITVWTMPKNDTLVWTDYESENVVNYGITLQPHPNTNAPITNLEFHSFDHSLKINKSSGVRDMIEYDLSNLPIFDTTRLSMSITMKAAGSLYGLDLVLGYPGAEGIHGHSLDIYQITDNQGTWATYIVVFNFAEEYVEVNGTRRALLREWGDLKSISIMDHNNDEGIKTAYIDDIFIYFVR